MADLMIRNARWLLTMDRDRRLITDGAVAITGTRIVAVGKTAAVLREHTAPTVIDASDFLVMPGLIEGHIHNTQYLLKGCLAECFLRKALFERIFPYETLLDAEDASWSSVACQIELIKHGVTTFNEVGSYFPDQVAAVTEMSGLRGTIARTAADVMSTGLGTFPREYRGNEGMEAALCEGEATVRRWHGALGGRLRGWFCLRFIQACSDVIIREMKHLADRYATGLQTHAGHSKEGIEATMERYGQRDVERLHHLKVLGPNLLGIHMAWLTMREVLLLKEHDVKVAYCPVSNLHEAYGTFVVGKFPEMIGLGITLCLGSDAGIGGHFTDIIRNMHLAASVYKDTRLDPAVIPHEKVIEMATIDGARAILWDDEIGSLEVGKKADVTILDLREPDWVPLHNPLVTLVYGANGGNAHTVIVDGRIIMQNRRILTFDEDAMRAKVQRASEEMARKTGIDKYLHPSWPVF